MMKFFFGLGNPGQEYKNTRHNAGQIFLDYLQGEWEMPVFSENKKVQALISKLPNKSLVKPTTYMNNSGIAIQATANYFGNENLQNLVVVYDDLDLELGNWKVQFGKGPKVHNGLNSVVQHLKSDQFWHVRIGVDGRSGNRTMPGSHYVLQQFLTEELITLERTFNEIRQLLEEKILQD